MFSEKTPKNEKLFNWQDIIDDVRNETPNEDDFDDVYSKDSIRADKNRIDKIKQQLGIESEFGISQSRIQEYAISQEIGEMDWFAEEEDLRSQQLFGEDGEKGQQTVVFLSSEFDDFTNHIDAICMMNNACSGFKPVPFALDMTYNTNLDKLNQKMSWRHANCAVNMPGLATARYFEDTFSPEPEIEKGRIPIMPRFIIGFDPDLSQEITELRMSNNAWESLRREELSTKAKWCVLWELKAQSKQLLGMLESIDPRNALVEEAYQQVKALDEYFDGAIEASKKKDAKHPEWMSYVDRDAVANAIIGNTEILSNAA